MSARESHRSAVSLQTSDVLLTVADRSNQERLIVDTEFTVYSVVLVNVLHHDIHFVLYFLGFISGKYLLFPIFLILFKNYEFFNRWLIPL